MSTWNVSPSLKWATPPSLLSWEKPVTFCIHLPDRNTTPEFLIVAPPGYVLPSFMNRLAFASYLWWSPNIIPIFIAYCRFLWVNNVIAFIQNKEKSDTTPLYLVLDFFVNISNFKGKKIEQITGIIKSLHKHYMIILIFAKSKTTEGKMSKFFKSFIASYFLSFNLYLLNYGVVLIGFILWWIKLF